MTEFHFEDPDLKKSTTEERFPSCAIERDDFTDSQGKQIQTNNKEPFEAKERKGKLALSLQSPSWLLKVPIKKSMAWKMCFTSSEAFFTPGAYFDMLLRHIS